MDSEKKHSDHIREAAEEIIIYFNGRVDIPFREDDPSYIKVSAILRAVVEKDREEREEDRGPGSIWTKGYLCGVEEANEKQKTIAQDREEREYITKEEYEAIMEQHKAMNDELLRRDRDKNDLAAMNPKLRVILIRDGSLMDTASLKLLAELAEEHDLQVWMEKVSDNGEGCQVVIEDGELKGGGE